MDRRNPRSVHQVLKDERISERTYHRKRNIAELMIVNRREFDDLVETMLRETGAHDRLNQQALSDRCQVLLKRSDIRAERRRALAAGQLI